MLAPPHPPVPAPLAADIDSRMTHSPRTPASSLVGMATNNPDLRSSLRASALCECLYLRLPSTLSSALVGSETTLLGLRHRFPWAFLDERLPLPAHLRPCRGQFVRHLHFPHSRM